MPTSSTVWWSSMWRSPRHSICMSIRPCRATWSSMCSRKGTPISKCAWPVPSRWISTLIWVSDVLRSTLALRCVMAILHKYSESRAGIIRLAPAWGYRQRGLAARLGYIGRVGWLLVELFLGQRLVIGVGIQSLLGLLGGVVLQLDQYRKVVRADMGQALDTAQGEMAAVEDVIQRPAQKPVVGVEGVEHAAADPRVQQAADLAKQPGGGRPGDIVQVAGNDDRAVGPFQPLGHQQQLDVALGGLVILGGAGGRRVQEMHPHAVTAWQQHAGMDRGHIVFDQPGDFCVLQRQPGIHMHAIEILQRTLDRVRVIGLQGV